MHEDVKNINALHHSVNRGESQLKNVHSHYLQIFDPVVESTAVRTQTCSVVAPAEPVKYVVVHTTGLLHPQNTCEKQQRNCIGKSLGAEHKESVQFRRERGKLKFNKTIFNCVAFLTPSAKTCSLFHISVITTNLSSVYQPY